MAQLSVPHCIDILRIIVQYMDKHVSLFDGASSEGKALHSIVKSGTLKADIALLENANLILYLQVFYLS